MGNKRFSPVFLLRFVGLLSVLLIEHYYLPDIESIKDLAVNHTIIIRSGFKPEPVEKLQTIVIFLLIFIVTLLYKKYLYVWLEKKVSSKVQKKINIFYIVLTVLFLVLFFFRKGFNSVIPFQLYIIDGIGFNNIFLFIVFWTMFIFL